MCACAHASPKKTYLGSSKTQKKEDEYFSRLQDHYWKFIFGNKLLTMPSALEAVAIRTISLLTTDVKTLIVVSRDNMEESLKCPSIAAKVLAKRSKAMWNILLGDKKAAEKLAGSILTTKSDADGIHEHPENKHYIARGVHGHHRRPFGGLRLPK